MKDMSNCLPCLKSGISSDLKSLIKAYKERGIERYVYKTNKDSWQIVDKDSFKIIHKELNKKSKTNGYEYYNIEEFTFD